MKLLTPKVLIIAAAIGIVAIVGMYLKKQYFDDGSMLTTASHSADAVWRLNAAGGDARVYEFPLQTESDVKCVWVAGTDKGGLDCFSTGRQ